MPPTADVQGPPTRDPGGVVLATVLAAGVAGRLANGFEWDELQLLHGAWAVGRGQVPFHDFFEHHPPLLQALLAPFVASMTAISEPLLLVVRLVAAGVLVAALVAFRRLVVRTGTTGAGAWAGMALVVVVPVSGKLFELRADWVALVAVLTGLLALVRADARGSARDAFVAGLFWGVALACSQKPGISWAAAMAWSVAPLRRGELARATRLAGALLLGTAVPLALLAVPFGMVGAFGALVGGTIGVNVGWPREVDWHLAWAGANPALAGPLALAALEAAHALVGRDDGGPAGRAESLVALVWLAGLAAYVTTPVPWEQSLVFFVAPWTACLALRALDRLRDAPIAGIVVWLAGVALASATLPAPKRAYVIAVWVVIAAAVGLLWRSGGGLRTATAVLLVPALVLFGRDRVEELGSGRARAQLAFARAAAVLSAPTEPVLTLWDHVLPFRPAASYHWFVHAGVLERFAGSDGIAHELDAELVRALDDARPRLVIADRAGLAVLPRFAQYLARTCRLAAPGYAGSDAYDCGARPG